MAQAQPRTRKNNTKSIARKRVGIAPTIVDFDCYDFLRRIDCAIDTLALSHCRVTLFSVHTDGSSLDRILNFLAEKVGKLGFVGSLPDETAGFFYFGPRAHLRGGDDDVTRYFLNLLRGRDAQDALGSLKSPKVTMVHGAASQFGNAHDLLLELQRYPAHDLPLAGVLHFPRMTHRPALGAVFSQPPILLADSKSKKRRWEFREGRLQAVAT